MRVLKINVLTPEEDKLLQVEDLLDRGGVIVYPTDTVYGIGCRIDVLDSVGKIYDIKIRSIQGPLSIACSDIEMVKKYAYVDEKAEAFMEENMKGYTFVLEKKKKVVSDAVTASLDTVGVRIIPLKFMQQLIEKLDCPIITTSANISGMDAPCSVEELHERITEKADLVLDGGVCELKKSSKVIDLRTGELLRG